MSWRTIVVSNTSKLDYQLGFMVVRGEETVKIHINEIEMLIIESTAVSLTAYLLNELVKNKVKVIFCDEKRNPSSELLPYYGSHDTSAKIRHQMDWTRDNKAAVWTEIVTDKIRKQAEHLADLNKQLSHQIKDICKKKIEEDNPINAALNYGYSLILSQFSREVVSNGYITQIGLFHDNMFNQFNLACDLMEPYRPIIDRMVVEMQPKQFETDEKHQMLTVLNKEVVIDGKKELLAKAVKIYSRSVFDALNDQDISLIKIYSL